MSSTEYSFCSLLMRQLLLLVYVHVICVQFAVEDHQLRSH